MAVGTVMDNQQNTLADLEPVGFWRRVLASLIDTFILSLISFSTLLWVYGRMFFVDASIAEQGVFDDFMDYVFPLMAIIAFWLWCAATPGKMLLDMEIVDARTGGKPTLSQWIIRYLGYFVSVLPLGLGIFWVAWDKKKQGWHDKMAKTMVVEQDGFEVLNRELDLALSQGL